MNRNTNSARLVCHRAGDCLADPPGCIRGELVALGVIELLYCTDQTEISFLNEIKEEHAASGVALGKGDHETKVCFEEVVLGTTTIFSDPIHLPLFTITKLLTRVEDFFCEETSFDPLCKLYFLLGIKECDFTDLLEVILHRISGGASGNDLLYRRILFIRSRKSELFSIFAWLLWRLWSLCFVSEGFNFDDGDGFSNNRFQIF